MTSFDELNLAYERIASAAIMFAVGRRWHSLTARYRLFSQMVSSEWVLEHDDVIDETGEPPPKEARRAATEAVRFLREDIIRRSGKRIWGLTFTLYPNGKFDIEYDYNKPEGYEETDETISGDEINSSLNQIISDGKNAKG